MRPNAPPRFDATPQTVSPALIVVGVPYRAYIAAMSAIIGVTGIQSVPSMKVFCTALKYDMIVICWLSFRNSASEPKLAPPL